MPTPVIKIPGIGPSTAEALKADGFSSCEKIASCTVESLCSVSGFGPARAKSTIEAARKLTQAPKTSAKRVKKKSKKTASKTKPKKKSAKAKTKPKKKDKAKTEKKSKKSKKPKGSKKAKNKSKKKSKKKGKKKK